MRPGSLFLSLLLPLAGLGGCVGGGFDPSPGWSGDAPHGEGKILIQWTLGGAPPSTESCAGADHLGLAITYDAGYRVGIAPIPCTLTRFRYDTLPEGDATIDLVAVDGRDCDLASGNARVTVSATLPSTPDPTVRLSAVRACR